jgi:hypothetical protein
VPIDDPELPAGFENRRDGARQADLIRDHMKGIGEENVIDRLGYDGIDRHGVRPNEITLVAPRCRNSRPRVFHHDGVDVDGVDAAQDAGEGGCEQPVAAAQIHRNHAGPHTHFEENLTRLSLTSARVVPPVPAAL